MSKTSNNNSNTEDSEEPKNKKIIWILIPTIIVILILWLANLALIVNKDRFFGASTDTINIGTFGDMFGAVNALFSGLAFAGIIITIYLQRTELSLQRVELRLTRKEFKTQNETLSLQRFESTFFHMINNHHEIIDKLIFHEKYTNGKDHINEQKREVFSLAIQMLNIEMNKITNNDKTINIEQTYQDLQNAYKNFHSEVFSQKLNHYFRNLYHIFKFINQSKIDKEQKIFYSKILRAQLSSDELFLIFYNSLIPELGHPKLLKLIKTYDILDNFDFKLIMNESFISIYNTEKDKIEITDDAQ